jgi:hypothetical protein
MLFITVIAWSQLFKNSISKWLGCEADRSSQSSAQVRNEWRYTFTLSALQPAYTVYNENHMKYGVDKLQKF